jgi:hypothetical protein
LGSAAAGAGEEVGKISGTGAANRLRIRAVVVPVKVGMAGDRTGIFWFGFIRKLRVTHLGIAQARLDESIEFGFGVFGDHAFYVPGLSWIWIWVWIWIIALYFMMRFARGIVWVKVSTYIIG